MKLGNWSTTVQSAVVASLFWLAPVAFASAQLPDSVTPGQSLREPSSSEVAAQRALANARFLAGDVHGALDALNAVGEPRIREIRIEGRVRARRKMLDHYLGSWTGEILTSNRLTRVARRLGELPIVSSGKVRYDLEDGSVVVRPIMFERDRFHTGPTDWAPIGLRALFTQEARVSVSNATGRGDVWTPSFRWAQGRPRVALQVAAPAPGRLPGVLSFDTSWQSQRFLVRSDTAASVIVDQDRARAGLTLSDWLTSWLRWESGAGFDRIASVNYLSLGGSLNLRSFDDHVATNVSGTWYASAPASTSAGEMVITARSTTHDDRPLLTGLAGIARTADNAPLTLWSAASTGSEQAALLRAHRLHQDGLVNGETFGRQMMFASTEFVHPLPTRFGPSFLGLAGFADAAQARSGSAFTSRLQVDIGAGVRVNTSRAGSKLRLDVGYGLRDGRIRLSGGYVQPWGKR